MPEYECPLNDCDYKTPNVADSVASQLLKLHNNAHTAANQPTAVVRQKPPKIDRPKISKGCSEETWRAFDTRWKLFKDGTQLTAEETNRQLFQCCDEDLGNDLLRSYPTILDGTEELLLQAIKKLAVTPVAITVRRSELLSTKQDHGESIRSFYAKVNGKAATCAYVKDCPGAACTQKVDFTDVLVKDVLVTGLVDEDIRRDVFGWTELDAKDVQETVGFIEGKEMAREALNQKPAVSALSAYRQQQRVEDVNRTAKVNCNECNTEMDKFSWSKRHKKMVERTVCLPCWKKANQPRQRRNENPRTSNADETSALFVGAISSPSSHVEGESQQTHPLTGSTSVSSTPGHPHQQPSKSHVASTTVKNGRMHVTLPHHIFDSDSGWKRAESMQHPTLKLRVAVKAVDYKKFHIACPKVMPSQTKVVTDTGAQSPLWGRKDFLRCGFKMSDLIPVDRTMLAANREAIDIDGAILIRVSGKDQNGKIHVAPIMAYVSPATENFYLSREALIKLGVISKNFPQIGENCSIKESDAATAATTEKNSKGLAPCGHFSRSLPPIRPDNLPYEPTEENIPKMKEWLLHRYASSTFNKCKHQQLKGMTGPYLRLHVDPNATPVAHHKPIPIALHHEEKVHQDILDDIQLGVLEEVHEPSPWCHKMVTVTKADGSPRRTVDLSPLNKQSVRETHHVKPPFQQARSIPGNTYKSVTDAWNGYHSVVLHPDDRHLTTFITPWGRFRYRVAPQGATASGDGYTRRYDEIIADVPRKTKVVDDTAMWDEDLETHWWRMIDYLELCGQHGIVLNPEKFQFCKREIEFAGFVISDTCIKPAHKFLEAIAKFPRPTSLTDVRSWFGLVHQVSQYGKLTSLMAPFRHLLSSKAKFAWSNELEEAFIASKEGILAAIEEGVRIFDMKKKTCVRPDWSKTGIGYFLSQKHCDCSSASPDCCEDGWRITLAGSRFLKPAESRYAPVEGEALAIAWALEQTKYFTLGCTDLLVVTDHKPLVKLLGDRTLDEIDNPRLFSTKQRTLRWRFSIMHMPGKGNHFADATSRHPATTEDSEICTDTEILSAIMDIPNDDADEEDECEIVLAAINTPGNSKFRAVTWDIVKEATTEDPAMLDLIHTINQGFPSTKDKLSEPLQQYWTMRHQLSTVGGVILISDYVDSVLVNRIIIPTSLRHEVLKSLHAAHQGVTAMNARAQVSFYWPGITNDIASTRETCYHCNNIAPSHARLPPIEPCIPTTPFEAIACDFFHYMGYYYFIAADRLSGWTETQRIRVGTNESGSKGLCTAFRRLFVTFGVPTEISSDGGSEFIASETKDFYERWGIKHRLSSAYLPSSNGRAELAVKSTKRLLMDNISPNGDLNNDKMVRALLVQRNTPDPGCKLSPAQILFGRPLRDSLPTLSKSLMVFNNSQISDQWRNAWLMKEEALKTRYVKTLESLQEHTRNLPPLTIGDSVMIQNQSGRFPTRWDRSGRVVEVKEHDQYVVKVSGTGRLTLRNRRFLRKYEPHSLHYHSSPFIQPQSTASIPTNPVQREALPATPPVPAVGHSSRHTPVVPDIQPSPTDGCMSPPSLPLSAHGTATPSCETPVGSRHLEARVATPEPPAVQPRQLQYPQQPALSPQPPKRTSSRIKAQTKVYDAQSGQYVDPNSGDE